MVNSTVPSLYGPLTVSKDKDSFKFMLPNLQFDDSDLVIKLGREPETWLLVHAEVLRSTCSLLAPGISETWDDTSSAPEKVEHPGTGAQVAVRTKALKLVDGTYVLEGKDPLVENYEDMRTAYLFSNSILATPGWSEIMGYVNDKLKLTRRALTLLVALLYGARLDCHALARCSPGGNIYSVRLDYEVMPLVINVCAIAEYWARLELIQPRILSVLKASPAYWKYVGELPHEHLKLAEKLEDAEIYRDALRHEIASAHREGRWDFVAHATG